MASIITQPGIPAHLHPDEAARKRADRLAGATPEQAEAALAFLCLIDPLMFEIAMDAGDKVVSRARKLRDAPREDDPGHPAEATRCLPGEGPEEL